MQAEFSGKCGHCGDKFSAGTEITIDPDMGWIIASHEGLPEPPAVKNEVCDKCFMEKSSTGACLCDE